MGILAIVMAASGTISFSGAILPAPESEIQECRGFNTIEVCECAAPNIVARVNRFNIREIVEIREQEIAYCKDAQADLKKK